MGTMSSPSARSGASTPMPYPRSSSRSITTALTSASKAARLSKTVPPTGSHPSSAAHRTTSRASPSPPIPAHSRTSCRAEPTDASIVDVNDVRDNMEFGLPDGWAVPGGSPPPPSPQAPVAPVTPPAAPVTPPAAPATPPVASTPVTAPAEPSASATPVVSPPLQDNAGTAADEDEETSEDAQKSGEETAGSDEDATGEEDEATGDEELEDDSGAEGEGQEDFKDDSDDSEEDLERRNTEEAILPRLGHVARALRRLYN
ncbi:hypothetical protein DFH09DRAFT_1179730 [Mycena vulgaris]|nr:hypothetical protein DFH09DRAFT_1179730 [Mycena vulgaris]